MLRLFPSIQDTVLTTIVSAQVSSDRMTPIILVSYQQHSLCLPVSDATIFASDKVSSRDAAK